MSCQLARFRALLRHAPRQFGAVAWDLSRWGLPLLLREVWQLYRISVYDNALRKPDEVLLSELRIGVHILDKGLQSPTWESGHSLSTYEHCSVLLTALEGSKLSSDPSFGWARAKMVEYARSQHHSSRRTDHDQNALGLELDAEAVSNWIKARRSVRVFAHRQISGALVRELAGIVNWAPNSCCRQPVFLYATTDPHLAADCMKLCAGATGFGPYVPLFICACADEGVYTIRDHHLLYIDVALGIQNLLLLAHAHGIEGTVLNWTHATRRQDASLRRLLKVADSHCIILNVALGYPDSYPQPPARKGLDLTYVIRWAER